MPPAPDTPWNRPGFALMFAILVVLLLSAVALGMVAIGVTEIEVGGAVARRVEARVEAESLARRLFHEWSTRSVVDLEPGLGRAVPTDGALRAVIERADSTLYLIHTSARIHPATPGVAIGRASLLVRVFDPRRTAAAFPAAATVEGAAVVTGGTLDGYDRCGSGRHRPGLIAHSMVATADAAVSGDPAWLLHVPPPSPAPHPLEAPIAPVIATLRIDRSTATPRPLARDGACLEDPVNWGAPAAGHPCHTRLPVVFAGHDLTVTGGEARAVLVVDGDLRLTAGASFAGIIVARDTLTVESGASIVGAARAGALVLRGGSIRADPCTVDAASSAPALDAGYRPSGRWWLPAF